MIWIVERVQKMCVCSNLSTDPKCIYKILKYFRAKKAGKALAGSRVFAFGEDSLALRLASELCDVRNFNQPNNFEDALA